MLDRWNTHFSTSIALSLFGADIRLCQDPSSKNLGTTVWDASIVLAKFFEKNARKGEFSRANVKGKRAVELGAGPGLGGMALALLGADVLLTDLAEVVPLIRKNVDANMSRAASHGRDGPWGAQAGPVRVQVLVWGSDADIAAAGGPFSYVIAADCVYHEEHVEKLHGTIMALTDLKSTVVIANELRSEAVQSRFLEVFSQTFSLKKVLQSKLAADYQHPSIQIYVLKRQKQKQKQKQEVGNG